MRTAIQPRYGSGRPRPGHARQHLIAITSPRTNEALIPRGLK